MKSSGIGTSILAREMALDIADALYEPTVGEHIPGVANVLVDHLSRIYEQASAPIACPSMPSTPPIFRGP